MKDNRPNYRITIRPQGNRKPLTSYAKKRFDRNKVWKMNDDFPLFNSCIGVKGYHPDSSKLKKV